MRFRVLVFFLLMHLFVSAVLADHIDGYPANLVENGIFKGKIVLGETGAVTDVLGAVDIATGLQTASTTSTATYHGVSLNGDAKIINGGKLQIRKKPISMLTKKDLKAFAKGTVITDAGSTDYYQFLRVGTTGLQQITANFVEDDDNTLADYMVIGDDSPVFEWEEQFSSGLESVRESDGSLKDLEGKQIGIVGANVKIVSALIDENGENLEMTFMGGSVEDTLREGELRTYTIDGEQYEVALVFVSDPNSDDVKCKFSVNNELTKALEEGETEKMSGGLQIGVREILVNGREGVVSFYLGAHKVIFFDETPLTENFDGTAKVDNERVNGGDVQVVGTLDESNGTFRIAWMKYRYTLNPESGSVVFMPKNSLLRDFIKRPEGMLSDINFHYHGVVYADTKNLSITQKGDDTYEMTFFNTEGTQYTLPLLTNKNGVWKYGAQNDDLIFVEGSSIADTNIGIDDYVVLSNNRGTADADKSATHIVRYVDYDPTTLTVEFESQADGSRLTVPLSSQGVGYLIPGGHTYKVNVSSTTDSQPNLSIDLDANGAYGNTIMVVAWGGVIINLAQNVYLNDSLNTSLTNGNISYIVGNGKTIGGFDGFSDGSGFVQMSATVLAKRFDTPSTDEILNWTITEDTNEEVDLSIGSSDYDGPLNTDTSNDNNGFMLTELDSDDDYRLGLTDFGIYITNYAPSRHAGELILNIPASQRYTEMYVSIGQVIHGPKAPVLTKINSLDAGLAVLDTQAPSPGTVPLIIIGGPCVNRLAAQLLETGEDCAEGFEPGKAIIQVFEVGDKIAVVIAGYDGQDTLAASRVLAKASQYHLTGDLIVINTVNPDAPEILNYE